MEELRKILEEINNAYEDILMQYAEVSLMKNLQLQNEAQWN